MEIKDYSVVAENIKKANSLLTSTNEIKNAEVKSAIDTVKGKMETWLRETCTPIYKLKARRYEENIEMIRTRRIDNVHVSFYLRNWCTLLIQLFTLNGVEKTRGLCFEIDFINKRAKFVEYFRDGLSYFCSCDESDMAKIINVWPEIKPFIEECMCAAFDKAKEKAIERAATIQKSLETISTFANFEA